MKAFLLLSWVILTLVDFSPVLGFRTTDKMKPSTGALPPIIMAVLARSAHWCSSGHVWPGNNKPLNSRIQGPFHKTELLSVTNLWLKCPRREPTIIILLSGYSFK